MFFGIDWGNPLAALWGVDAQIILLGAFAVIFCYGTSRYVRDVDGPRGGE